MMVETIYKERKNRKWTFYLKDVGKHNTYITESVARFLKGQGFLLKDVAKALQLPASVFDVTELNNLSMSVRGELLELQDPMGMYKNTDSDTLKKAIQTYENLLLKIDDLVAGVKN